MKHIQIAIKHSYTPYQMRVRFASPHTIAMICYLTCKTQFLMYVENVLCMCANQYKTVITMQYISMCQSTPLQNQKAHTNTCICKARHINDHIHAHIDVLRNPHIYAHTHTPIQKPMQTSVQEHDHDTSIDISTHHCTPPQCVK